MTFNKVNPGDLNGFTLFCFNEDEPEIDELGHHQLNSTHPDGFASEDDEEEDFDDEDFDEVDEGYEDEDEEDTEEEP